MAGEWREVRIEEVAERVAMGPFGSSIKVETFVPAGVPVISGQHLHGSKLNDSVGFNFVSEAHADRLKNANVQRGDVIFTHAGNIGQVAFIPPSSQFERYVISQRQFYMRCDRAKVLPEFVVAYFKTPEGRHQLLANTSQVGVPSIAQPVTYLRKIEIPLPPLPEQRAIAHILGTLDDKIELNRRMNETLEAMARALFKSWFVDFDPVRAKAEGRDPGLPKPLADLFPARLVDSELGEIPEGWEVRPLRDLTGYLSRGIGPAYVETGGICVLNQKCIRDRRVDFSKARRHDLEKKSGDGRLLQRLDVLVNSTGVGTLGRAAQLWHLPEPTIVDSHVTVLRAMSGVDPWFLGVGLTGREDELEALGEGSTGQTELSRIRLGDLPCIVPSKKLQARFGVTAERLIGRLSNSQRESDNLAMLRDALLPKLISGELRLRNTERIVEVTT